MPYQDVDDIDLVEPARSPSPMGRLMRKVFLEDWGLKLIALGITLVLWLAVTDLNKPRTIRTAVQLNFIRPGNLEISNEPPKTVDVELTGSRERLNGMKLLDLVATIDISDSQAGERVVRLSGDRVQMELPTGVKINSFRPTSILVRLEPNLERRVPVGVKVAGQPAEGYELVRSSARPSAVTIRGPASLVENLTQAPTESVSIAGRKESFTLSRVAIDISDPKIDLVDATVDVAIEIAEKKSPTPSVGSASGSSPLVAAKAGRNSAQSYLLKSR